MTTEKTVLLSIAVTHTRHKESIELSSHIDCTLTTTGELNEDSLVDFVRSLFKNALETGLLDGLGDNTRLFAGSVVKVEEGGES